MLTTERPGFGSSTRLPGRGFAEHADDLAAVLDAAGLASVYVMGPSGAAPHILSLCERHAARIVAATIVAGSAPLTEDEAAGMIATNRGGRDLVQAGDREALRSCLGGLRDAFMSGSPSVDRLLGDAPTADRVALEADGALRFITAMRQALRDGVDGWFDETLALLGDWADITVEDVPTSITWHHGRSDRNCPYTAAERLVSRMANARLVELPAGVAHLTGEECDGPILDELLQRG